MNILSHFLRRNDISREQELAKPYSKKAQEAILRNELPKAIAYLERGISLAPSELSLYLQRAQVLQYGMNNCARALQDYRFILRKLEDTPNDPLVAKCREGMKDMMAVQV